MNGRDGGVCRWGGFFCRWNNGRLLFVCCRTAHPRTFLSWIRRRFVDFVGCCCCGCRLGRLTDMGSSRGCCRTLPDRHNWGGQSSSFCLDLEHSRLWAVEGSMERMEQNTAVYLIYSFGRDVIKNKKKKKTHGFTIWNRAEQKAKDVPGKIGSEAQK